jgi:hypothetical protein
MRSSFPVDSLVAVLDWVIESTAFGRRTQWIPSSHPVDPAVACGGFGR